MYFWHLEFFKDLIMFNEDFTTAREPETGLFNF